MGCERLVSFLQGHVAGLTFAEIFKHAVGSLSVSIAVRESLFTGYDEDEWTALGRDDPALSLTLKAIVNVGPPIVDPAFFKAPAHDASSLRRLRICVW